MNNEAQGKEMAKTEPTYSQRFAASVMREFSVDVGKLEMSPFQRRLAQHLFIAIDAQLRAFETKRLDSGKEGVPIAWNNINLQKLAIDSVHRIELSLDALVPNHIHPVPYFNKRTGKYDLDLRIGYIGRDYIHRKMALEPPEDIIYELVYEKDKFKPIKKTAANPVESYEFEIMEPFDRGKVIGGFGYIAYRDPSKNKLVIVSKADFEKSKKAAGSDKFWGNYEREMQFKTLVHRVTSKLNIDPEKVSAAFLAVEMDDNAQEIQENANQKFIDIKPEPEKKAEPNKKFDCCAFHSSGGSTDLSCGGDKAKAKTKKVSPVKDHSDKAPDDPNRVFLACPEAIDNHRPRKAIEVCHQCKDRMQCDPYTEYQMENAPKTGEAVQGELRPVPDF